MGYNEEEVSDKTFVKFVPWTVSTTFANKKTRAAEATKEYIGTIFDRREANNEGEGYASSSSMDSDNPYYDAVKNDKDKAKKRADFIEQYSDFVDALPYCTPFESGFHVQGKCSMCPCCKGLKTWQETFHWAYRHEPGNFECKNTKFDLDGLRQHLTAKTKNSVYHELVLHYMQNLLN